MLIRLLLKITTLLRRIPRQGILLLIPFMILLGIETVDAQQIPAANLSIEPIPVAREGYTLFEATPATASKKLPGKVNETSGLIWFRGSWWTHNDSGGKPEIYKLNNSGSEIIQTVRLIDADNIDWEDITTDGAYLYVGDFGNNYGKRTNLAVYKIACKDVPGNGDVSITPQTISFTWSDQKDMNPKPYKHNFDCESLFYANRNLWLLSKNWDNFSTRLYTLPTKPGHYNIFPVSEFDVNLLVTGADYDSINMTLALIGYKNMIPSVWLFRNFNPSQPEEGEIIRIDMTGMAGTQTEGICFGPEGKLWVSAEKTKVRPQMIYELNINSFLRPSLKKQ